MIKYPFMAQFKNAPFVCRKSAISETLAGAIEYKKKYSGHGGDGIILGKVRNRKPYYLIIQMVQIPF